MAVLTLAAATVAATAGTAPASARTAERPDLSIPRGAVHVTRQRIVGTFTVRDRGRRAGRVGLALTVRGRVRRSYAVRLRAGATRTVRVNVAVPGGLPTGRARVRACADPRRHVHERSEHNNCRTLGTITTRPPTAGGSTVPPAPIAYAHDNAFTLGTSWAYVPSAYDDTHATPTQLFVWLHGCGGQSSGDIWTVAPAADDPYIALAVGGREGQCWDVGADQSKVLAAIADVESHFNVDRRRIVLGGYSSGGDLTYRTAFFDARMFAGVLVENSTPFRDTGSTPSASIAAAGWRFPVVQLAHLQDTTYPIATVRSETATLRGGGFPVTLVERTGTHYDDEGATVAGETVPGTDRDVRTYLLPHLGDGWRAPAG